MNAFRPGAMPRKVEWTFFIAKGNECFSGFSVECRRLTSLPGFRASCCNGSAIRGKSQVLDLNCIAGNSLGRVALEEFALQGSHKSAVRAQLNAYGSVRVLRGWPTGGTPSG